MKFFFHLLRKCTINIRFDIFTLWLLFHVRSNIKVFRDKILSFHEYLGLFSLSADGKGFGGGRGGGGRGGSFGGSKGGGMFGGAKGPGTFGGPSNYGRANNYGGYNAMNKP